MSTATSRSNLETRKQLEELDALIQRMLSMPLAGEEAQPIMPAPPTPIHQVPVPNTQAPTIIIHPIPGEPPLAGQPEVRAWRVEVPVSPPPSVAESSLPFAASVISPIEAQLPPAPRLNLPPISADPQMPTPMHFPAGRVYDPTARPQSTLVVEPPMAEELPYSGLNQPPLYPVAMTSAPSPTPLLLLPILGLNRLIDVLLLVLGPLGLWLRGGVGRNLVGWLGILLILGATAWALRDRFGLSWPL